MMRFIHARVTFPDGDTDHVLINPAHIRFVRWHHPDYSSFDCRLVMMDGSELKAHIKRERLEELGLPIKEDYE